MEGNTFDRFVGRLGNDAPRRRVLGGLIGTAALALAGGTGRDANAKPSSRSRRRQSGKSGGGATGKVTICHFTAGRQDAERLGVGGRALRQHLAHGDVRFDDCCVNADCEAGACFAAQCVSGTCSVTQLPQGTPCQLDWPLGGLGGCTPGGNCVPTITAG